MAELAAISAAASIIQLIDFTTRVISRLKEYQVHNAELPGIYRDITIELPILKHTLQQLKAAYDSNEVAPDIEAAIKPAIVECLKAITALSTILEKVTPEMQDSWSKKQGKALRSLFHDSDVAKLISKIRELVRTLTFASIPLRTFKDTTTAKLRSWMNGDKFSAPSPLSLHWKARKKRLAGTCQWFLKGSRYAKWQSSPNSFLWRSGIPGAGKSVMASGIIDALQDQCGANADAAVAYFYFDFNDPNFQSSAGMLKSLVNQLFSRCLLVPPGLDDHFKSCNNGTEGPSPEASLEMLRLIVETIPEVYIVLDALDECQTCNELMDMIASIKSWDLGTVHFLVTSRHERDIAQALSSLASNQDILRLQSADMDHDIQAYIKNRLTSSKWNKDGAICEEIEIAVLSKSHGMFRWAACQLDAICKCLNKLQLRRALSNLPRTLEETYERILLSIEEEHVEYALRILRWIAFARRPMFLHEVAEIVAIDCEREPAFDPDERLEDGYDALTICGSLVTIIPPDQQRSTDDERDEAETLIVLSHLSVKEYLTSSRILSGPASLFHLSSKPTNSVLARSCIIYSQTMLRAYTGRIEGYVKVFLRKYRRGLLRYAVRFFSEHIDESDPDDEKLHTVMVSLLVDDYVMSCRLIRCQNYLVFFEPCP